MRVACNNVNSNHLYLSKVKIDKAIYNYNGVYGRALFNLYDKGYIDSPSVFNYNTFMEAINFEFKSEIPNLVNGLNGKIGLDDEYIVKYAIYTSKNLEFKEVMSDYIDIIKSKSYLDAYSSLLSIIDISKKRDIFMVKSKLSVNGKVFNKSKLPLDNKGIIESFYFGDDEILESIDTSHLLIKYLMNEIGCIGDYQSHKNTGKSFFIDGITQEEEIELVPALMDGRINANGKYGRKLLEYRDNYYTEFYKNFTSDIDCVPFEELIFDKALNERSSLVNEKRKELELKYGVGNFREFYVTSKEVIFSIKSNKTFNDTYFKNNKLRIGAVALNHDTRGEFSKLNTLLGLSGEFISEEVVERNGYLVEGIPLKIKFATLSSRGLKVGSVNYYPIYNVYYNLNGEKGSSIQPLLGNSIHIILNNLDYVLESMFEVSNIDELRNYILDKLDDSVVNDYSNYKLLVSDLTTALVLAECGVLEHELADRYIGLNDSIFYRACIDAEKMFRSLGF